MSNNCAAASLFGWDFQINAAIAILIDNIGDIETVRLEGASQDIEITLSNDEKIYAQAKAVERAGNYNNVKNHLIDALNSLNNSAHSSTYGVKQFIYITNSENPMGNQKTMSQFTGGYVRRRYADLSDTTKEIIDNALSKSKHSIAIDKDKLYIYVLNFQNGATPKDRYANIKRLVDDFVETLLENRHGIGAKILDVWQKELLLNGSVSNTSFTLKKQDFTWIIIVKAIENSYDDNDYLSEFDLSEVQEAKNHFDKIINSSSVRFEFITAVLSDFKEFSPQVRSKKTLEFIAENWHKYKELFYLETLDANTQEILIKLILKKILYQSSTINRMRVNGLI